MVEHVGGHRLHEADVVGHAGQVRQQLADFRARFPVPMKLADGPEQLGVGLDEGEPFAFDVRLGNHLPMQLTQLGLVVEQFELTRPARHEQEDHRLRLGIMVQSPAAGIEARRLDIGGCRAAIGQQRSQRHRPQPDAAIVEEMPSRDLLQAALFGGEVVHAWSLSETPVVLRLMIFAERSGCNGQGRGGGQPNRSPARSG